MSDPDSLITFRCALGPQQSEALERFARRLCRLITGGRIFHCLISTDRELRRLNRRFRRRDAPTDVLSFPVAENFPSAPGQTHFLGDIAISLDRAARQARRLGHSLYEELCILMLHGVLHLTGMDHSSDGGEMARAEMRWRKKFGLPAALTERVSS